MKLIATADWHIKKVPQVPWEWQQARYLKFTEDLIETCLSKEATLVIAGDLADSASPKPAELKIIMHLFHELYKNNITTLLVGGNHESLAKGDSFLDYLEVHRFPNVVYRDSYTKDGVKFHLVNHDIIHSYKPKLSTTSMNVLISHFRCNVNAFITEEIDVEKFTAPYDLNILGDIHMPLSLNSKVHYCNNPVNKEFESSVDCGYLEIDITSKGFNVQRISTNYPSLRYLKMTAAEYLAKRTNAGQDYYKIEVEGTPEELRKVQPLRNVILSKVPVLPNVLQTTAVEQADVEDLRCGNLVDGLLDYMKKLKYSDEQVNDLMSELRRQE